MYDDNIASTIESIADGFEQFKREQRNRLDMLETKMSRPGAFAGSTETSVIAQPTADERRAFSQFLQTGVRGMPSELRSTLNVTTTNEGAETVVAWFDQRVRTMARAQTPILNIIGRQSVGNFPSKHIVGDSNVMGSEWLSEQATRNQTDTPAPRLVEPSFGEWSAKPQATEWILMDAQFDVESWLVAELAREYSNALMVAVVTGNGTSRPTGFLSGPTPVTTVDASRAFGTLRYFPTGQAATLPTTTDATINLLLDVVHSLRPQYRQNGRWVMNATTLSVLRKLKDADNRPLMTIDYSSPLAPRLLGYEIIETESMPVIGAGNFPIAFGDFEAGYLLTEDAGGMRMTRDGITLPGWVKFYTRARAGGKILDSNALRLIKVAAS
jgi:HK97 family phage major capsid protein